ncbi:nitric oxide synthase, inducible-like [Artemia franciscana]|uniref:nitric oxide synthase, inducible-like n=1 Tax=Artemia franciscana TaxID=6661 RepID=UPI0032DA9D95
MFFFYKSLKKRFVEQGNTPNIASDKPARLAARIQAQEGERNMRGPLVKLPSQRFEDPAQIVKSSDWLINVRFSCFALGSTVYKDYCAFGKALDALLGSLGAERIHRLECGDEMSGQEKTFKKWANDTFQAACEAFHIKLPTKAVVTIGTESVQEPVQSNMKLVSADASEGPHFTECKLHIVLLFY